MSEKIAVATTDGKTVNQHFGRAGQFDIIRFDDATGEIQFLERRSVISICQDGEHEPADLRRLVDALSDCGCVLVSRIGPGAHWELQRKGIRAFELPGSIEDSIEKMVRYMEIQKLLTGYPEKRDGVDMTQRVKGE